MIGLLFQFLTIFSTCYGIFLVMSNNGPSVLDGSIKFYSSLSGYTPTANLCFTFEDGIQSHVITSERTNVTLITFFTSDLYAEGSYIMNATVNNCQDDVILASTTSNFDLREYLIGKVIVNRDAEGLKNVDEVAVGENITMSVDFYDPNGNLASSTSDYMWSIDYELLNLPFNNISYKYVVPEVSKVSLAVSKRLTNDFIKYGYFGKNLTVKVPVSNVNYTGNPFIHHGEILAFNISCNGSAPFMYCARPLEPSETGNFSCNSPITSTTCNFHFRHYFRDSGNYRVGIFISNDVKTARRILDVVVYNVSKKPQLSTVIIPIVCSLLTLCIIAAGVGCYVQHKKQMVIEVANFDFQEESLDSNTSSTFFEKIFQACVCRVCKYKENFSDDVDEEEEPLLSPQGSRRY